MLALVYLVHVQHLRFATRHVILTQFFLPRFLPFNGCH